MIGKTNALAGMKQKQEMVNISLSSNQASHDDLVGAVITLSYGEYTEEIVWNGSEVTRAVPAFVEYTVSFGDVENHKTPDAVTNTSVDGNVRTITGTYLTELVSVTLAADDGSNLSGQTVTVNGVEHTFDGNVVEQKVAYGVTYSVSASDKDGYATPEAQTFTAAQSMRNLELTYIASALKVNILSNQENDSNIAAVKATVTYGDTTLEVASGEQVGIPTDTDVTITYPEVEGYKTPEAETFRNSNGGVAEKTGTYYTEVVYISTYADEGTPTGFVTTVTGSDGAVLGSFTTDMSIIAIPSGITYTVSCSDVDGFETPSSKTYTADSITNARRDIPMGYEKIKLETLTVNVNADDNSSVDGQNVTVVGKPIVDNGIYIQDINGKLWAESAWDNSVTPNGIAVVTSECQFVMALTDTGSEKLYWGGNNTTVAGLSNPSYATDANKDYSGESNTDIIINALSGVSDIYSTGAPAAESCRNFTFPSGRNGYLGACGEWQAVYVNLSTIKSALNKCGGDALADSYSSSTQRNETQYWYMRLGGTYTDTGTSTKSVPLNVRAFAPLTTTETQPVTNGKATFQIPYDTEYTVSVDEKSGYTSPASQTYTASQATRTITMTYEAPKVENLTVNVTSSDGSSTDGQVVMISQDVSNGVYIEDIDGNLWNTDAWDGSVTPNGVAVISDNCRFVIALEQESKKLWGETSELSGITTTSDINVAQSDYNGLAQTQTMANQSTNVPVADYCLAYTYPNGNTGYLGAAGEWKTAFDNEAAVNSALAKCGGTAISGNYWTSTQYGEGMIWTLNWGDGNMVGTMKSIAPGYNARAFSTLKKDPQKVVIDSNVVTNGKTTFTIPLGVTYEVSVSAKESYITPASKTYTAASGSRTVSMHYVYTTGTLNPSNGVYIQETNGYCFPYDEWTGLSGDVNGIAVITDNCRFVIPPDGSVTRKWGGYSITINDVTTTTSSINAMKDYDGEEQTTTIISSLNGIADSYNTIGAPAAEYCRNYTFPNGQKGYLGAAGEWQAVSDNKTAIDEAMSLIGGISPNEQHWTSTQYSIAQSWCSYPGSSTLTKKSRNASVYTRPFTTL